MIFKLLPLIFLYICFERKNKTMRHLSLLALAINICLTQAQMTKHDYLESGKEYYYDGFLISAIESFNQAIEKDADFADAYYYKGLTYKKGTQADFYSKIAENFKKAIQLDTAANYWEAYLYLAMKSKYLDQDYPGYFDKALELEPENAGLHEQMAKHYLDKNLPDQALENVNKAIELDPGKASAWYLKANIQFNHFDETKNALATLDKAIKLNPYNIDGRVLRVKIVCKMGKCKKAKKDLEFLNEDPEKKYTIKDNELIIK